MAVTTMHSMCPLLVANLLTIAVLKAADYK